MACARLVDDVRPNPSCDHRTVTAPRPDARQVAHRMEGDLGVVRARLHAEIAPAARRVELVAGQRRERTQRRGPLLAQAEAIVKDRRPEAEGDRQPRGREAERLAGVVRRRQLLGVGRAHRAAGRHALGRTRPRLEQVAQVGGAQAVLDVEGREVQPVLRRGRDARLIGAVEGNRLARGIGGRVVIIGVPEGEAGAAGGRGDPPSARRGEQMAAREAHRYPPASARDGARESGSARASMTSLRRRTSGLRSAV